MKYTREWFIAVVLCILVLPGDIGCDTVFFGERPAATGPADATPSGEPAPSTAPSAQFAVTFDVEGQGSVDAPGGTVVTGTALSVRATPTSGWRFDRWSGSITSSMSKKRLRLQICWMFSVTSFTIPTMMSPEEISITRNTTESLNIVILGYPWEPGDEAIMTNQDYPNMLEAFAQAEKRYKIGRIVISIPLHPKSDEEIVQAYEKAITPKTRVILCTHMINLSGQILPVRIGLLALRSHRREDVQRRFHAQYPLFSI